MKISPGTVIEIKGKDRIYCGVVLSSGEKQVYVLSSSGKEFKISPDKVLHVGGELDLLKGKDFLLSALRALDEKREALKNEIQLKLLWQTLGESEEVRSAEALANLYFGSASTPDHAAGMLRAIHADWGYFRPRGEGFFPVDARAVLALEEGRKQQALHKAHEEAFLVWLASGASSLPPQGADHFLEILEDFLIHGEKSSRVKQAQELLRKGKISDRDQLFEILEKSGRIQKNENLLLKRYKVPTVFPQKVEEEAQEILRNSLALENRLDFTHAPTISIDDETTTDIDDAISLESVPGGFRIGIHIADVSEWVLKDSLLDKEAQARSTSIYLPDQKITMLPQSITEAASLKMGEIKPALSIVAVFRENGHLVSCELKETVIKVKERLTYEGADEALEKDSMLSILYQFAEQFREERKKSGALVVQFPKIELMVDEKSGEIFIKKPNRFSKSQVLVSEWMIFANKYAASLAYQKKIPVLYRIQEPPAKVFPIAEGDWVALFRQRRCIRKGEMSVEPFAHHGLGLPFYLQMTSPIRRYTDLVIHRQLKAFLRNQPFPYTEEDLQAIQAYSDWWNEVADLVEKERKRYWLLKYLEKKIGEKMHAVVLEANLNDYLLFIPEYCLEVSCPRGVKNFSEGDLLQVSLELVKPHEGLVKVIPL
jgi:exoribonuclease-2